MAIVLAIDTPTLRQLIESVATVPGDRVERPTEPVFYVLEEAILGVGGLLLVTAAVVLARGREALGVGLAMVGLVIALTAGAIVSLYVEQVSAIGVHDRACRRCCSPSSTTATGSWRTASRSAQPTAGSRRLRSLAFLDEAVPTRYGFGRRSQRSRVRPRTRGASPALGPTVPVMRSRYHGRHDPVRRSNST